MILFFQSNFAADVVDHKGLLLPTFGWKVIQNLYPVSGRKGLASRKMSPFDVLQIQQTVPSDTVTSDQNRFRFGSILSFCEIR